MNIQIKLYDKNLGTEIAMSKNLLRELIKKFPPPKNEIIPTNPEDKKIAQQMTQLLNHHIMEQRSSSSKPETQIPNDAPSQ